MKMSANHLFVLCLFISAVGFSGCELFEGGMNTVEPPTLSAENPPVESVLKDLAPVRPRDMMISEHKSQSDKD